MKRITHTNAWFAGLFGVAAALSGCRAQSGMVTRHHPTGPDANWAVVEKLFSSERAEREKRFLQLAGELERENPTAPEVAELRARHAAIAQRRLAALPKECIGPRGISFVLIQPGEFLMGSSSGVGFRDEYPQHLVRITKPFYIGKYEITEQQLRGTGGEQPAGMSWHDAVAFCNTLSSRHGVRFALPTEAEWEYCCRAGTNTNYSFGNEWSEPASREPNPWGLYDMHGNVWEWCQDWYDRDYYGKSPKDDPAGPATGQFRVVRGGSWFSNPYYLRSAARYSRSPGGRLYGIGVRVVLSVAGP